MSIKIMHNNLLNITKIVSEILTKFDISFAYLFGSYAKNKIRFKSDADIALYFHAEPDLYTIGKIVLELEQALNIRIDLVSLNNLHEENPALAFNILNEGILLFSRDNTLLTLFRKRVFISYLDHKEMIDKFKQNFLERLNNNRFAE